MPLCTPHTVELDLQDLAVKPHAGSGRGGPYMHDPQVWQLSKCGEMVGEGFGNGKCGSEITLLTTEYEYMENIKISKLMIRTNGILLHQLLSD